MRQYEQLLFTGLVLFITLGLHEEQKGNIPSTRPDTSSLVVEVSLQGILPPGNGETGVPDLSTAPSLPRGIGEWSIYAVIRAESRGVHLILRHCSRCFLKIRPAIMTCSGIPFHNRVSGEDPLFS